MIGKILGDRYEVLEKIGEGGMSFVYKARCRKLNRYVAVKILKDIFKENEEIISKFKREATSIANLSNSNIVNVLDVGTQDNTHYIVMEFVKGKTLKEIIKEKGKLPYEVALSIAIRVAKALECAHKNSIIHRDVKPQNILVTEEGVVKVTDFGIAKSMDSSTIAHTNSILGSAHYFSPEQAKGGYIDCRTDLYSLGIVLYEMMTGMVPFDGDSPVTVAVKHIQEAPVSPKSLNSAIPDSLNTLILKAIDKDVVNRYQSAREFISDLEKIKNNPNAIILTKAMEEEQFTRVMSSVIPTINEKTAHIGNEIDDDFEDDDEDEYEDDEIENSKIYKEKKKMPPKKKKKSINWKMIFGGLGVVIIGIIAGFLFMRSIFGSEKTVAIPNIISLTAEEAKTQLEDTGLVYLEVIEESSDEKGIVISTKPSVGNQVPKGSVVTVAISGGESKVNLPSLVDMKLSSAKEILGSLGIAVGKITYEYSDTIASENIIRHTPETGTEITKNEKVDLVVSKGAETRVQQVPDLTGKSVEDAKTLLENLKFTIKEIKGDKAPSQELSGKIYEQDPGPGYDVKEGTTVTVYYYDTYKEEEKLQKVPDLKGKSVQEAKNLLQNLKLNIKEVKGEKAPSQDLSGKIYKQDPGVGYEVKEGSTVTIYYYDNYETPTVPEPPTTPEPPTPETPKEPGASINPEGATTNTNAGIDEENEPQP